MARAVAEAEPRVQTESQAAPVDRAEADDYASLQRAFELTDAQGHQAYA